MTSIHKSRSLNIAVLPGDGIGVEVISEAIKVLEAIGKMRKIDFELRHAMIGISAFKKTGDFFPKETKTICDCADSILFGAVEKEPLLELRSRYNFYANIRPVKGNGIDLVIFRELSSGIYFGNSGIKKIKGVIKGYHTMEYSREEIQRIATLAFCYADKNKKSLVSVDKDNALPKLQWRKTVDDIAKNFKKVRYSHLHIDNALAQLYRNPGQFDVIVTSNMFGDLLSDLAAEISGSIGLAPSASINEQGFGMFEPIHGTAPDIAGKGMANPIAAINSAGMMLEHLGYPELKNIIQNAISLTLNKYRTPDMVHSKKVSLITSELGDVIVRNLHESIK